ncbi:uncharacterized protein LOC127474818 isoform X2 [Manacus candei]|uniref:uncharacterized protein LOC127474818 isoform X2 n=1 Tax=Manacus candei TaxID=415023 RepID=UPI0022276A16|nr:uncharacterized protein LOC127474818 isoform X2 [Manacus candei]
MTDDTTSTETTTSDLMAEGDATSEGIGNAATTSAESVTDAPSVHFLEGKGVSSWKSVPAIVWYIHHDLTSHVSPHTDICRLAEAHPRDVVMTLLRCAPECDRAAAMMWRSIGSSGTTVEKVLPTLLRVMEDWPVHGMSTSDGDNRDVFALAATLALWLIIQEPNCQGAVMNYIPRLLMALLFQVSMSTEQVPEEVNTFWRGCLEQHHLPTQPNRFLVQTMKALLCHLPWEDIWMARKRRLAWDPLLNSDTHHYAVGLHVREMRRQLTPSHSPLAIHLLGQLSSEDPRWELPALEFLVELLDYLDGRRCHSSVEQILSRHLQSECPERRRLALRGRMVLWTDLSMAQSICSLSQHLLELLPDADGELVVMTLSVFVSVLRDKDIQAFISTAPKLAEVLWPLFDNLSSFHFLETVMEVLVEGGTKPLEMQMHQSLVLWFFLQYDEHQCVAEVPTIVRSMHQCLTSHMTPGVRMHTNICRLTEAHPHDVVMTLLRCAPECDRAAAMMWRSIGSSGTTVEKVLPTLLRVMEDWPVHRMSTSDGDNRDVFALAATLALWLIIQEPKCQDEVMNYIPRLLMALLFQVSMSTEQVPEEVNTFWRGCLEQHRLPTQPSRFLVQTIKALFCRLQWDNEVVSVERKCGWDTLLCADTQHYAVGLLAREMRHVLIPFYSPMAIHLLGLLSTEDSRWELPALAFLVEVLDFLDRSKCCDSVLPILSRNLRSQCQERQRLALRGLLVLAVDPSMAQSICSLSQHLLELLPDADGELVVMTLSVFVSVLRDKDIQAFISTAPKLAEVLWPLFDNLSSFHFLETVMEVLVEGGTKPLEMQMHQSLVLWFFLQYDEHQCVAEVPTIVRSMHQCLTSHMTPGVRMHTNICRLTEAHPHDVVMTLLRCAPECDRAAAMMWRSIGSSGTTVEKVLPTLLRVMEDWPVHRMSTSDGDNRDVFALAATLALWLIIQEPKCQDEVMNYIPRLLMALLFQVSMSTEQVPEEVNTFWRGCLEQHRLPTQPSRFLVQTIKALFCRLQWDNEVVSVERKCGWDTLLCADTQHYAVGLLAREMRHVLIPFYSPMAIHLLGLLSTEDSRWELPALAFLVEVLDFLDRSKCCDSVLPILSRNLRSQCQERQRLALRGLLVLAVDPSMAQSICSLSQHLLELLPDADGELVVMTLSVFESMLQDEDIRVFVSTAPKLAEALRPLFDNDNTHVQLLSIHLFQEVMELLVEEGTQLLETQVHQSLVPLFIHGHDENQCVAEASREVLLCAARFLKRRDLEKLLRREQHFKFCDCLMDKDVSRRAEHLQQALPYLQSPQQPLREAAVRFMGIAAWHMQDLQLLMRAFEAMSQDDCPSYCTMRTEFLSAFRRAVTK